MAGRRTPSHSTRRITRRDVVNISCQPIDLDWWFWPTATIQHEDALPSTQPTSGTYVSSQAAVTVNAYGRRSVR